MMSIIMIRAPYMASIAGLESIDGSNLVSPLIGGQNFQGVFQVFCWLPRVVSHGISLPFDQVLVSPSSLPMSHDGFDFILRFSFDQVRWRSDVIRSVGICFDKRGKERRMEDWVNVPSFREF